MGVIFENIKKKSVDFSRIDVFNLMGISLSFEFEVSSCQFRENKIGNNDDQQIAIFMDF